MKNRLVFRIFGALASALIIVSVFIPFVSVTGYSQSLWNANSVNTIYLPIMIIVFGAIGVLAFAINIKTELAYASSGALLFYLVTQTIPVIEQNLFNTLSVGYYCLAVGTVLTGVMAFICNLRVKKKIVEDTKVEESVSEQVSVIDQIDKLYNDTSWANDTNIQDASMVQPLPIQPLENAIDVQPLPEQPLSEQPLQQIESLGNLQPINQSNQMIDVQPTNQMVDIQPIEQNSQNNLENSDVVNDQLVSNDNSVPTDFNVDLSSVQEIPEPAAQNPVAAEFAAGEPTVQNPVTAEFAAGEPAAQNPVTAEFAAAEPAVQNPVTAEFNAGSTPIKLSQIQEEPVAPKQQEIDNGMIPLSSENLSNIMAEQKPSNGSNLDIFG